MRAVFMSVIENCVVTCALAVIVIVVVVIVILIFMSWSFFSFRFANCKEFCLLAVILCGAPAVVA